MSGAAQLKTRGASGLRPMISHSGAYSRLVSPAPYSGSGQEEVPEAEPLRPRLELFQDLRLVVRVARVLDLLLRDRLRGIHKLVHEALDLRLQQLRLLGRFEVHVASRGCRGPRPLGAQGRTLTLTAPDFLSEASAKPRSTACERHRVGGEVRERAAMAVDEADRRREIGLARARARSSSPRRGVASLSSSSIGSSAIGAEEEAEHDDAAARPDRVRRQPQRCRRCRRRSRRRDRSPPRSRARAGRARRTLASRSTRAAPSARASSAWCGWRALTKTSPAPSARAASAVSRPTRAGAEHEHALPGAQARRGASRARPPPSAPTSAARRGSRSAGTRNARCACTHTNSASPPPQWMP